MKRKDITAWAEVIHDPEKELRVSENREFFKKKFIDDLSEFLYEDMRRSRSLITSPFTINRLFSEISEEERKIWYDYAAGIPGKLKSLELMIRPATGFIRTCIITDEDIEKLASIDHEKYFRDPDTAFSNLPGARKWYFRELNYLIPPQLKKIGFEIFRTAEEPLLSPAMLRKLARAIHSRYLQEMRNRDNNEESTGDYLTDYDNLPDEIKYSNADNAYHIANKLLAIGYRIKPVNEGFQPMALHLDENEIETMSRIEHLRWSWDKRLNGWIFGNMKDSERKTHPGLIPYEELTESEKEKDRELVRLIPGLLQDIGYEAYPVVPDRIAALSYAIKPRSSIHKLLNETRKLNEEISGMSSKNPVLEEKVRVINRKIEETIAEVQGNYNYARHIQETYLPEDLFIRECFTDSFVLFKPKDIVSGDFYFFSKRDNIRIFAAADCTGHGIPGALLSTLGYGITDQAVNEIKLTDPSEILDHLYSKVHKFLRRDDELPGMPDDMDIALCSLDLETRILTYAGVSSPIYVVSDNQLHEYKATNFISNSYETGGHPFTSEKIRVKKGDIIYLSSDGYTDQFGGRFHKKYQRPNFKSLLLNIHMNPMPEQRDMLFEEFERWRGENDEDQTDDILVIGIKI